MLNRSDALSLLEKHNTTQSLLRHALATEAVMRALAEYFSEDSDLWGLTGLLHDLDYPETEQNPENHGLKSATLLAECLPEKALTAIKRHNAEMNGTIPESRFDYALRCGETVTGLISAAALLRPTGYEGMTVKSIKKKMKDKAFAANINREIIRECEKAGIGLDEFLALAINAMGKSEVSE